MDRQQKFHSPLPATGGPSSGMRNIQNELDHLNKTRAAMRRHQTVNIWISSAEVDSSENASIGLAGSMFNIILELLKMLTRDSRISKPAEIHKMLKDETERLFLWGSAHSVPTGALDEVLLKSPEVRKVILTALYELGAWAKAGIARGGNDGASAPDAGVLCSELTELLERAAFVTGHLDRPDSADDEDISDVESATSSTSYLDDLVCYVDCLVDLSNVLEGPFLDLDSFHVEEGAARECDLEYFNVSLPEALPFCRKIRDRFPRLQKHIVERLATANTLRVSQIQKLRTGSSTQAENVETEPAYGPMKKQVPPPTIPSEGLESSSRPTRTESSLSTFQPDPVFETPERPDTGFEDPIKPLTMYAPTLASFSSRLSHIRDGRPQVPPLPNEAGNGVAFVCFLCNRTLTNIATRTAWKKHVFDDLSPYVCTIQECDSVTPQLFKSSQEWASHELSHRQNPRRDFSCPFCERDPLALATQFHYFKHLSEHLREISLAPLSQFADEDENGEDKDGSATESLSDSWLVGYEKREADENEYAIHEDEKHGDQRYGDRPPSKIVLDDTQKQALLDSLKFDEIGFREMIISAAHPKTCRWLLNNPAYLDWLDPEKLHDHHGFLWIKGKPGSGKSTLMKFALANARKSMKDRTVVSFFFNARGTDLEKSTIGMYRSLLLQILEQLPQLQSVFDSLGLAACSSNHIWSMKSLKDLFRQTVQSLGQSAVICFIDALDECDHDQIADMLAFFQHLGALTAPDRTRFQVIFSSRHYPHITRGLSLALEDQEGHDMDIYNYVDSELRIGQSALEKNIRSDLLQESSGMFMWVVLLVGILNYEHDNGSRIRRLQQNLREIPQNIFPLFRDILTRDNRNREELILCIQWALYSCRPLAPEQLYFAVLSGTEPYNLSAWDQQNTPIHAIETFLLNSSKGLVQVTKSKRPTVQFIHKSVRDFLLKENGLYAVWPDLETNYAGQSHDRLKQCCLAYMDLVNTNYVDIDDIDTLPKANSPEGTGLRQRVSTEFPFFQYAVESVLWHAEMAQREGLCQKKFLEEFGLIRWLHFNNIIERYDIRRHTSKASLLYILAEHNLPALIRAYENNLHSFDVEEERYGPPILAASACGSQEAVVAMLEAQRQARQDLSTVQVEWKPPGRKDGIFSRDFSFSKKRGLASYLAESGDRVLWDFASAIVAYNVDSEDGTGRTPLSWAASRGHEAIVKLLLDTGWVDANSKDGTGRTPLSWAAENGHEAIVKLLFDTGRVDADSKDTCGRTPLRWASENGHEAVVKLLLDTARVNADSKDKDG